jgi:hypothetical protein
MADGQLGDVFEAFFGGGITGYQEILVQPGVKVILTQNDVTFKKYVEPVGWEKGVVLTAAQFKALAEIVLPNTTQTTTINVEEVKKKLTPIRTE